MDVESATPVVDTPVATPVETPSAPATQEPASIAELAEATFGTPDDDKTDAPDQSERVRRWSGQFGRDSQRAKSQKATPKDADEIAELTKRWHQAQADAGVKIERRQGESERAFALRQRTEIAEALRDAKKAPKAEPIAPPRETPTAPAAALAPFDKPKPKPADFGAADDPLEAYTEAMADWKWDKKIHEAQQKILADQSKQSQTEALQRSQELQTQNQAKLEAFKVAHPDFDQVYKAATDLPLSDLFAHTMWTDDKFPELYYYYLAHPDHAAELSLVTGHLPIDDQSVALLRRRLHAQAINAAPSGPKGALPPAQAPVIVAPRPPTPLGTGPMKTREEPPTEPASIDEMKRWYPPEKVR